MKSKIYLTEKVKNKDRRFGSALEYITAWVVYPDGTEKPALFTMSPINEAIDRADDNPEDIPERRSLLSKLFKR
jgi:hypothetical protein